MNKKFENLIVCTDHSKCMGGIIENGIHIFLYEDGSKNNGIPYKDVLIPEYICTDNGKKYYAMVDGRKRYW